MTDARIARLRERLAAEGVDALLVKHGANVRYLSGFTAGEDAALLISRDRAHIITAFVYYEQAEREAPGFELFKLTSGSPAQLADLARELGVRRVAFESVGVTYAMYQELSKAEGVELIPVKDWVEDLRVIKTPDEIARMRRAVEIADSALAALPSLLRPGMTERQLAWELEVFMRTHGADDVAFPIIVAGGPNGSMPHIAPSDRVLVPGEPIVIDLGARVEGYCSDVTRTVCLGQPDDRLREVYAVVLAAQRAAEEGIRAGLLGKEADALARQVIEEAHYGEAYGHGLGHGVGLEVHERPSAGQRGEERLQPGMAVTVEPGIYLPGWGGVRIEDLVVVTETGVDVLTTAPKEPVVAG